MKMTDILERDRESIINEIATSGKPGKSVKILENELDKLLLKHNEQCTSDRERDAAAYMTQTLRLALPLIDSFGEAKVWETRDGNEKASVKSKSSIPFFLLLIGAVALAAYGLLPLIAAAVSGSADQVRNDLLLRGAFVIAAAVMAFFAGTMTRRSAPAARGRQQVEIRVDAAGIYRHFKAAVFSIDQSLEEVRTREMWELKQRAGSIDGRPAMTPELELFADLLEASYSGDPEYALEKIEAIKYYLHKQQIEVVDYSNDTAKYFDLMPGSRSGTIRPALVAEGNLLKKGLASAGR